MTARFDWYTASIGAEPAEVIARFESSFELSDVQASTPKNGYERAYNFVRGSTILARYLTSLRDSKQHFWMI